MGFHVYGNLFWIIFSLLTCIESHRLKLGSFGKPGSGFFPFGAGLIMLILSIIALFQNLGKNQKGEKPISREPMRWWNIAIILAAIPLYTLSLEKIGFLINNPF